MKDYLYRCVYHCQLRAYVYIEKTKFRSTGTDAWEINYRIKNFGLTPAHNVRLISIAKVVDWKERHPAEIPTPNHVETIGSMAPNGDFFEFDEKLEGIAPVVDIRDGNKAIFLLGTIIYDTVFDIGRRTTSFSYYIGGDMGCDGDEMFAASEGNDAT